MDRHDEPLELPDEIYQKACRAAEQAELEHKTAAQIRAALQEIEKFLQAVKEKHDGLSGPAKELMDPDRSEYAGYAEDVGWPGVIARSKRLIEEYRPVFVGKRGAPERTLGLVSNVAFRAYAAVLREWFEANTGHAWSSDRSGGQSPAERFLFKHAHRWDDRITTEACSHVIERPASGEQSRASELTDDDSRSYGGYVMRVERPR